MSDSSDQDDVSNSHMQENQSIETFEEPESVELTSRIDGTEDENAVAISKQNR